MNGATTAMNRYQRSGKQIDATDRSCPFPYIGWPKSALLAAELAGRAGWVFFARIGLQPPRLRLGAGRQRAAARLKWRNDRSGELWVDYGVSPGPLRQAIGAVRGQERSGSCGRGTGELPSRLPKPRLDYPGGPETHGRNDAIDMQDPRIGTSAVRLRHPRQAGVPSCSSGGAAAYPLFRQVHM